MKPELERKIQNVLEDYTILTALNFRAKYGTKNMHEGTGFIKAIRFVLEVDKSLKAKKEEGT